MGTVVDRLDEPQARSESPGRQRLPAYPGSRHPLSNPFAECMPAGRAGALSRPAGGGRQVGNMTGDLQTCPGWSTSSQPSEGTGRTSSWQRGQGGSRSARLAYVPGCPKTMAGSRIVVAGRKHVSHVLLSPGRSQSRNRGRLRPTLRDESQAALGGRRNGSQGIEAWNRDSLGWLTGWRSVTWPIEGRQIVPISKCRTASPVAGSMP